ncbi:MAG: hypothetical protein ABI637_10225 [Gemmatimonadota bacterium]
MFRSHRPNACLGLVVLLGACARQVPLPLVEVSGACGDAFQGRICTWAHTKAGNLIDAGATIPIASIDNAPADAVMSWPPAPTAALPMPATASARTGLREFTFLWEATGHPPAPFLTPHFDFHFYLISQAERIAITCADRTKPAALPADYSLPDMALPPDMARMTGVDTLVGVCVPRMGMHSVPTGTLTGTAIFRGSVVVGYYKGKPIFIEPMIARAMLAEKKSFDLPIPTIPGTAGPYPRTFHATWDDAQQVYYFTFSDFAT